MSVCWSNANTTGLLNLRLHADNIVNDSRLIGQECKLLVEEYNNLILDVHAHEYTKAVEALNAIISNSEKVVAEVVDMKQESAVFGRLLKTAAPIVTTWFWLVVLSWQIMAPKQ